MFGNKKNYWGPNRISTVDVVIILLFHNISHRNCARVHSCIVLMEQNSPITLKIYTVSTVPLPLECIHISSIVMYRRRNSSGLRRNSTKPASNRSHDYVHSLLRANEKYFWILSFISKEISSSRRPELCSSFVDVRPRLNSFFQL